MSWLQPSGVAGTGRPGLLRPAGRGVCCPHSAGVNGIFGEEGSGGVVRRVAVLWQARAALSPQPEVTPAKPFHSGWERLKDGVAGG